MTILSTMSEHCWLTASRRHRLQKQFIKIKFTISHSSFFCQTIIYTQRKALLWASRRREAYAWRHITMEA
jgi:hypothetical protein